MDIKYPLKYILIYIILIIVSYYNKANSPLFMIFMLVSGIFKIIDV